MVTGEVVPKRMYPDWIRRGVFFRATCDALRPEAEVPYASGLRTFVTLTVIYGLAGGICKVDGHTLMSAH